MKASEVISRHANGERDFRRTNLRGQSFKGQDLSGADFSGADIQGATFTNAILRKANFTEAKAGLQKRWIIGQLFLALALSVIAGSLQGYFAYFVNLYFPQFWNPNYDWTYFTVDVFTTGSYLIAIILTLVAIISYGFTIRAFVIIAITVAVAIAVAGVITIANDGGAVAIAGAAAGASAGVIAVVIAVAVAVFIANVIAVGAALSVATCIAVGVSNGLAVAIVIAVFVAVAIAMLSLYVAYRASKGDERFTLVCTIGVALIVIGGTSFRGTDLTSAIFTKAMLKSTNFTNIWEKDHQGKRRERETILERVCWKGAQKLDRARVGASMLENPAVRELLVTGNGYKKSYVNANLHGANLNGANLNKAILRGADLSAATLHQANLEGANLREVLAVGTDFTGAYLTGACLEAWNIDHTTKLDRVDCRHVFLLEQPNCLGSQERRPHNPDRVFAPGDFEQLYKKMINVVQILLRNGINREAFRAAFENLMQEHPAITFDSIQAIEKKGNDVLLTIEVPATTDKAKFTQDFLQPYTDRQQQLEAKVDQLHLQRASDLKDIALELARNPIQNINQLASGDATMNESTNKNQNINVGGNFNLDAANSIVNLGEISGNVTNSITQLQQSAQPQAAELADLLTQLQAAIAAEPDLPPADKTEALEQVATLAKAGEHPQDGTLKKLAGTAIKILKGTIAALPDTAKLAESCSKLLPLIAKAIGLTI